MSAIDPRRIFAIFVFLFTLAWSGFSFFWCVGVLGAGKFSVGKRGSLVVTPETHPWYFWGVVLGWATVGFAVLTFGVWVLLRARRDR